MTSWTIETPISAKRQTVFDLARDIDAHTRSLSGSKEQAVAGVTSGLIGLGETVTWQATHLMIRFRMTSAIVEMDAPNSFVDEQVSGPFKNFRHVHRFETTDGGTLMIDKITFESPMGLVGKAVNRLVLGRYMRELIEQRNQMLKTEAEEIR